MAARLAQGGNGVVRRGANAGGDPDFHCEHCGCDWTDGPLPPWWPPTDVRELDDAEREIYGDDLDLRYRLIAGVVQTLQDETTSVALDLLRRFCPDPGRNLDDFAYGDLVVASDRVLQAEALAAGEVVCRMLIEFDDVTVELESRTAALQTAVDRFRLADDEYRSRQHLDVLRNDDRDGSDLNDETRLSHLVGTGIGEQLPPVGQVWDDWLADTATELFDDGSAMGWARYIWSLLSETGLTVVDTELDRARAQVRLTALATLRRSVLARLDGSDLEDWPLWAINPGVAAFHLGVLAGIEGVEPGYRVVDAEYSLAQSSALIDLVRIEARQLAVALRRELGVSPMFAVTWASRFVGARYPLGPEAMHEALNANLTPEKHGTFEWIDGGMVLP